MTWEEFENANRLNDTYLIEPTRKLTDIDCPKCGKKIYVRTDIVLTSYPPQSQYECDCGWVGYH